MVFWLTKNTELLMIMGMSIVLQVIRHKPKCHNSDRDGNMIILAIYPIVVDNPLNRSMNLMLPLWEKAKVWMIYHLGNYRYLQNHQLDVEIFHWIRENLNRTNSMEKSWLTKIIKIGGHEFENKNYKAFAIFHIFLELCSSFSLFPILTLTKPNILALWYSSMWQNWVFSKKDMYV